MPRSIPKIPVSKIQVPKVPRPTDLSKEEVRGLLVLQQDEITAYTVYSRLASVSSGKNKEVLEQIAQDEARHYAIWQSYTGVEVAARPLDLFRFSLSSGLLGVTFTIKLLEKGEVASQNAYAAKSGRFPELPGILEDERRHEQELCGMIEEEKLVYIGSVVLGLNDALVELTGALAGLSLAFRNARLVGISGLITGIAASLSMMASEYLAKKADTQGKNPRKAAGYTGLAYVLTVLLLVTPYFLFDNVFASLASTVIIAIIIIACFTYFSSVVHGESFRRKFSEMALISIGVAAISFVIGLLINRFLGIPV